MAQYECMRNMSESAVRMMWRRDTQSAMAHGSPSVLQYGGSLPLVASAAAALMRKDRDSKTNCSRPCQLTDSRLNIPGTADQDGKFENAARTRLRPLPRPLFSFGDLWRAAPKNSWRDRRICSHWNVVSVDCTLH